MSKSDLEGEIKELDRVCLKARLRIDGTTLHAGQIGTVVHAYTVGKLLEVDFAEPLGSVVTLKTSEVERVGE